MIKGLSMFSNVGIAETYLKEIGIDIIIANELDSNRANLYKELYGKTKMIQGDIRDKIDEIIEISLKNKVQFLIATPPCQGFSIAGRRDYTDDRNDLIHYVLKAIDKINPEYVVIENVQNFLKHSITYGKYKGSIISVIKRKFSNKYNIEHGILNAKDYGVPQVRKRAFIIMKKLGEPRFPIKEKEVTVYEAIGHLKSIEAIIREEIKVKNLNKLDVQDYHFSPTHCFRHIECMRHTPTGKSAFENKVYYPKKLDGTKVKGYNTTYKRMKWDAPAPTITTANGVLSSQCNVHPGIRKNDGTYSDARVLSLKEIIILFSLPEDWKVPGKYTENFIRKVIGEGVPPLWMKKIVETLISGG